MTNLEPELITSTKTPKGQEKIDTIQPDTIEVPNYDYGQSQNTLDANIALRNLSSGGVGYGNGTLSSTGSISITGLGFTPRIIQFTANLNATNKGWSDGFGDASGNTCRITYYTGGAIVNNNVANLAYCLDAPGGVVSSCNLTSLDSDGFTLNVVSVNAGAIIYNYLAFA